MEVMPTKGSSKEIDSPIQPLVSSSAGITISSKDKRLLESIIWRLSDRSRNISNKQIHADIYLLKDLVNTLFDYVNLLHDGELKRLIQTIIDRYQNPDDDTYTYALRDTQTLYRVTSWKSPSVNIKLLEGQPTLTGKDGIYMIFASSELKEAYAILTLLIALASDQYDNAHNPALG